MRIVAQIIVGIVATLIVRAYLLPFVMYVLKARNWLHCNLAGDEGRAHVEEFMADLADEMAEYRVRGDSSDVVALKVLVRLVTGSIGDATWWSPHLVPILVDKAAIGSRVLRRYRASPALIASVAILPLMNFSLAQSKGGMPIAGWLGMNAAMIGMIVVMTNLRRRWARMVLYSLMGLAAAALTSAMVWLAVGHHLYENPLFRVALIGLVTISPAIVVSDKSLRHRISKGRWWIIAASWGGLAALSALASWLTAGSIVPLLQTWGAIGILTAGMAVTMGVLVFVSMGLCWLGIRGSSGGLRLVAAGLRHLR